MISEDRQRRMRQVLQQRLTWVHCAMEALYHRHNTSAVLRTCDAMGLHHVHLIDSGFKASKGPAKGAARWLSIRQHADPSAAIAALKERGVALWVADLGEDSRSPEDLPLDRPVCLWFGAELVGVCEEARAHADGVMTIPMYGFSQSLNVSVAAALAVRAVCERARQEIGPRGLLDPEEQQLILREWQERELALRAGIAARARLAETLSAQATDAP